jgi:hypothetical protein
MQLKNVEKSINKYLLDIEEFGRIDRYPVDTGKYQKYHWSFPKICARMILDSKR